MKRSILSPNAVGIVCSLVASMAFTLNDVGIKFLSGEYPLYEIVFMRGLIAITFTVIIFMPIEGGLRNVKTSRLGAHITRGFLVVAANLFFFTGLASLPLADATAIFFVAPLIITMFSVIFLGEKVGPWRWAAVAIGFCGAVIMVQPGSSTFRLIAILPILAATCYAATHMFSRRLGKTESASTLGFYVQIAFLITCVACGLTFGDGKWNNFEHASLSFLFRPWIVPTMSDLVVMLFVGLASSMGNYFISQAYRVCDAALIAPFEYAALIMAIIWGISFFAEWPSMVTWTGSALILTGGLLMIWRETVQTRRVKVRASEFKGASR